MEILYYLADQKPHRDRSLGISQYTLGLIDGVARLGSHRVWSLESTSSIQALMSDRRIRLPWKTDRLAGRLVADYLGALDPRLPRVEIHHYPKGFLSPTPRRRGALVGTVCDTILVHYAEKYPRERSRLAYQYLCGVLASSLRRFDLVCTLSQFSKRCIEDFCRKRTITPSRIVVTYLGARWEEEAGSALSRAARGDYVIHLASIHPHKGTRRLLDLWRAYRAHNPEAPRLLLVGSMTPEARAEAESIPGTQCQSGVSDAHLEELLREAQLLLLPSEIEGFGLPALEALYLGTPTVFPSDTAIEEVLGKDDSGRFELGETDSFMTAVDRTLLTEPAEVKERAVALADRFSWARCVDRTIAAYSELL